MVTFSKTHTSSPLVAKASRNSARQAGSIVGHSRVRPPMSRPRYAPVNCEMAARASSLDQIDRSVRASPEGAGGVAVPLAGVAAVAGGLAAVLAGALAGALPGAPGA